MKHALNCTWQMAVGHLDELVSIRVNVCMSKIMHMPLKVGVWTNAMYANCQTLTLR